MAIDLGYSLLQLVHWLGIILVVLAFGGVILFTLSGGQKVNAPRKMIAITHGVGLLLALIGGFGMAGRSGIGFPFPGWLWCKLVIWLALGGLLGVAYRRPAAKILWFGVPFLVLLAGFMALVRPF